MSGWLAALIFMAAAILRAGPFSNGYGDPGSGAVDEPVPGFLGPAGPGIAPYLGFDNTQYVNPIFTGWATGIVSYAPAHPELINTEWKNSAKALGAVTGDAFEIVSLGDLTAPEIAANATPGSITLEFAGGISDGPGADFAMFENALGVGTDVFCELAYVEVSSNGVDFARFQPEYLNAAPPSPTEHEYFFQDPTIIRNLAGKHFNGYGESWGTPFDLSELASNALVIAGNVNLSNIRYVRLVDIPGSGAFTDKHGNPIYDAWLTWGSPGLDLDAVGVIHAAAAPPAGSFAAWTLGISNPSARGAADDPDGDGIQNLLAYALGGTAGQKLAGAQRPYATIAAGSPARVALVFPCNASRAEVNLVVESAPALAGPAAVWTPLAVSSGGTPWVALLDGALPRSTVSEAGGAVTVADNFPPAVGAPRFLRLRANAP